MRTFKTQQELDLVSSRLSHIFFLSLSSSFIISRSFIFEINLLLSRLGRVNVNDEEEKQTKNSTLILSVELNSEGNFIYFNRKKPSRVGWWSCVLWLERKKITFGLSDCALPRKMTWEPLQQYFGSDHIDRLFQNVFFSVEP